MVAGAAHSKSIGFLIVAGDDFPPNVLGNFQKWGANLVVKEIAEAKSTRGVLQYLDSNFGRTCLELATLSSRR